MKKFGTAIILAGGKSSRMGFDKQLIKINGIPLIAVLADKLGAIFEDIIIVTNRPDLYRAYPYETLEDHYKDVGPLGGIHAGLSVSKSRYNYIIACDMPYLNLEYIYYMKKLIEKSPTDIDAMITKHGQHIEPINSFFSKSIVAKISKNIREGKYKISTLLKECDVFYIEEQVARAFSSDWKMFMNLNTGDELRKFINDQSGGSHGFNKKD